MVNFTQTDFQFCFLTDLLKYPIIDTSGRQVGVIRDLIIEKPEDLYPKITAIVIKSYKTSFLVRWQYVEVMEKSVVRLNSSQEIALTPLELAGNEILLKAHVLDRQIVDIAGRKAVRVNDLHFLITHEELRLVHVDVGIRGLIRRLGWEGVVDTIVEWLFSDKISDRFVSWKNVQLLIAGQSTDIRLPVPMDRFSVLHPADIAEIMEDLSVYDRANILRSLDPETAAEALTEINPKLQHRLVQTLNPDQVTDILEEMAPDDAADLLGSLPEEITEEILEDIEPEMAEEMRELLTYEEDSAGGMMTTEYICIPATSTVEEAFRIVREAADSAEILYYLYVVDQKNILIGIVTLRHLLMVPPETPISLIMTTPVVSVKSDQTYDEITDLFSKYDFNALPVVSPDNELKGLITLKDALDHGVKEGR